MLAIQGRYWALAGERIARVTVERMPDPRADLAAQELLYAATALRAEAHRKEQAAADPQYGSICVLFRESAHRMQALAAKFDRIAAQLAQPEAPRYPRR